MLREDILGLSFFDSQVSVKHKKSSFKSRNVLTMVSYDMDRLRGRECIGGIVCEIVLGWF